jgi:hypothetical protein
MPKTQHRWRLYIPWNLRCRFAAAAKGDRSSVAPGAQLISIKIGDSRNWILHCPGQHGRSPIRMRCHQFELRRSKAANSPMPMGGGSFNLPKNWSGDTMFSLFPRLVTMVPPCRLLLSACKQEGIPISPSRIQHGLSKIPPKSLFATRPGIDDSSLSISL